jgi:uncharacterized Fe-S cluster-containing radical SAM superfamily protein
MVTKFQNALKTADGKDRAFVDPVRLETLWFNTGTLCNIECANCYIESSPRNDRLAYLDANEVISYLDEIEQSCISTTDIGLTGGEPFMNKDIIPIMTECLVRGFQLIVLTNAMRPMMRWEDELLKLNELYGAQMTIRVSVDHFDPQKHEQERGDGTWEPMLAGLVWLSQNGFTVDIAGRTRWEDDETYLRGGFAAFFQKHAIAIDAFDPQKLVLFPEMDPEADVPEITTECWGILGLEPGGLMCAASRMIVKHKNEERPSVMACTLLPYEQEFQLGHTLKEAQKRVYLNHPHCAKFCVLGGGSCHMASHDADTDQE